MLNARRERKVNVMSGEYSRSFLACKRDKFCMKRTTKLWLCVPTGTNSLSNREYKLELDPGGLPVLKAFSSSDRSLEFRYIPINKNGCAKHIQKQAYAYVRAMLVTLPDRYDPLIKAFYKI